MSRASALRPGDLDLVGRRVTLDDTLAAAMREGAFTEASILLARQGLTHSHVTAGRWTESLVIRDPDQRALADLTPIVDAVLAIAVDTLLQLIPPTRSQEERA